MSHLLQHATIGFRASSRIDGGSMQYGRDASARKSPAGASAFRRFPWPQAAGSRCGRCRWCATSAATPCTSSDRNVRRPKRVTGCAWRSTKRRHQPEGHVGHPASPSTPACASICRQKADALGGRFGFPLQVWATIWAAMSRRFEAGYSTMRLPIPGSWSARASARPFSGSDVALSQVARDSRNSVMFGVFAPGSSPRRDRRTERPKPGRRRQWAARRVMVTGSAWVSPPVMISELTR